MRTLFYDCFSGISGDMNIGALLDLGVSSELLLGQLARLDVDEEYSIDIHKEERGGISGTRFDVSLEGHGDARGLSDIEGMIRGAKLNEFVEASSLNIFRRLAAAEATVHGMAVEDVHFHEVGAIDSIIDIVGGCVCFDALGVDRAYSSPPELGGGYVECSHGTLPVPAPATVELLKGVPVRTGNVPFEATTPTGAALLSEFCSDFVNGIDITIENVGYGLGRRDGKIPNALRVIMGEPGPDALDSSILLECNIDDMNPELFENAMDLLIDSGASDVYFTQVIMKKGRPGVKMSVLVRHGLEERISELIFKETTTLGLRRIPVGKYALYRDETVVKTRYGTVRLKHGYLHGRRIKTKPEYEDCRLLAKANNVPIKEIYDEVSRVMGDIVE